MSRTVCRHSSSLWWTFGCEVLVDSPVLWGLSAQWVMQNALGSYERRNHNACREIIDRILGKRSKMAIVKKILNTWKHSEARLKWGPLFEKRCRGEQMTTEREGNEFCADLCVALVQYKTKLQRDKIGLCSSYLASLGVSRLQLLHCFVAATPVCCFCQPGWRHDRRYCRAWRRFGAILAAPVGLPVVIDCTWNGLDSN